MEHTPFAKLFTMASNLVQQESARRRASKLPMLQRSLISEDLEANEKRRKSVKDIKEHVDKIMASKHKVLEEMQERIEKALDDDGKPGPHSHLDKDVKAICEELGIHVDADKSWFGQFWFTWFRLRQAFFLMCAFAILLSLFTGLLMEVFYSIMGGDFKDAGFWISLKWHMVFWALPFYMMILALLGDEMCDLILDSLDSPPLHSFQAMLITAMHLKKRPWMKVKAVRIADYITLTIFELVPLAFALGAPLLFSQKGQSTSMLLTLSLEGYVQGSLLSAILCTVIFVVTDMRVAYQSMGEMHSTQGLRLRWFSEKIDGQKLNPYRLHKYFAHWAAAHPRARCADDNPATPNSARAPSFGDLVVDNSASLLGSLRIALLSVAVWTLSIIFFSNFNDHTDWVDVAILGAALVVAVAGCSWSLHKVCPSIYGMPFILILTFFVIVGVGLNIGSAFRVPTTTDMNPIMSVGPGDLTEYERVALPPKWNGSEFMGEGFPQPYPVCAMTWGSSDAPLSALDLANLAWIVYDAAKNDDNMKRMLHQSFPEEMHAKLESARPYEELPRWAHFHFPPQGNATRGTRVVAVKGTSTTMDALVDTNLFSTVKVLQMFNLVLPVLNILPRLLIQWLLHRVHMSTARQAEKKIWETLEGNISNLVKMYPNDSFVITGHSLGGGLSQIAAANLSLPALVWSSPGAEYSAKRFGIEVQALKRSVVSVMPDHDVVPRVDLQAGTLQLIECRAPNGHEESAVGCHSLVKTACEIWRVCGDDRDFRQQCAAYVHEHDLGRLYTRDDSLS